MSDDAELEDVVRRIAPPRLAWWGTPQVSYWLTRLAFLRALGFIYFVAFLAAALQVPALIGERGLLPVDRYLPALGAHWGGTAAAVWHAPSLFWIAHSDLVLQTAAWCGVLLSLALATFYANAPLLALLWFLYLSFVHVGQVFYGYGWEMLLLEAGFLAIFLAPPRGPRPGASSPPPSLVIWMLRWLLFRLMFGAGLIKVRGDACWTELTCLFYHYETQPLPNPLSWYLHHAPEWLHRAGVLFNHFVELVVPWGLFGPRRVRQVAGALTILFQIFLILSGNLSFLNWLTIAIALACFDDRLLGRVLGRRPSEWARVRALAPARPARARRVALGALGAVVALLSLNPVVNLLSPTQHMNEAYDPFHLVNSYGAFGSVGRRRYEVVLEGTDAASPTPEARWREYELPCKPGDVTRRPCVVAPYQPRLDWQIWFAAFSDYRREPWIVHLAYKLLTGERRVMTLLANDPFPKRPPRYVRALLYEYRFTEQRGASGAWWRREPMGLYLRPVSADDPELLEFLRRRGWLPRPRDSRAREEP